MKEMQVSCWVIAIHVPLAQVKAVELAFEDMAAAVASFEQSEKDAAWKTEIVCEAAPDREEVKRRLEIFAAANGCAVPSYSIDKAETKDWMSDLQKSFPAFRVGRFFIHGSHITPPPRTGMIPLLIDAGMAFGSGEHATTAACLDALDRMMKRKGRHIRGPMLDMGCGSGILAIGMAKYWKQKALAVDLDKPSVRVAAENMRLNRVRQWVPTAAGDGFHSRLVKASGPYTVIAANILARPLIGMAKDMRRATAKGGTIILSGLLNWQEQRVLAAYVTQGFTLQQKIRRNGWSALVLKR